MRSKASSPFFFSTEGMLMAKNKPTPRTASTSKEREWYATTGWKVFNDLLTELAASQLDVIWIENFDEVRTALANVNRKTLVQLFNADSMDWQLKTDADGTLYMCRTK